MPLFGSSGNADLAAQLTRIERKLDTLLSSLGLAGGASPAAGDHPRMGEVRALVASGAKIEAIKVYREITGLGLKEAKDAIDAIGR